MKKISAAQVRADFNDLPAVIHYTRAAHELGLWQSERILIERFFPDRTTPLLEAGCGSGRVSIALWQIGYGHLTAFDFATELIDQAHSLAAERGATAIRFLVADATALGVCHPLDDKGISAPPGAAQSSCHLLDDNQISPSTPPGGVCHLLDDKRAGERRGFGGVLFMFNGLMQIPGRENRRTALRELHRVCAPGAPLLFTTHDRDSSPMERALWRMEAYHWDRGEQDPRLPEFGDRYFEDHAGRTFMHLPIRDEILKDLAATGWKHTFDAMRTDIAKESKAVRQFSDECRFWSAIRS